MNEAQLILAGPVVLIIILALCGLAWLTLHQHEDRGGLGTVEANPPKQSAAKCSS